MRAAEITSYVVTKINKNRPVSLKGFMKICHVFRCDIGNKYEVILDEYTICKYMKWAGEKYGTNKQYNKNAQR